MGGRRMWALGAACALSLVAASPALAASPTAQTTRVGPAPASQSLQLMLPLTADLAGLRREALAVTTPGSLAYGAYQPFAQLARRYGAAPSTRARVLSYLRRAGASQVRIDATGLFAEARMKAGLAARLFETPLAQFRTAHGARFLAPAGCAARARIPAALRGLVTGVAGLDNRPVVSSPLAAAAAAPGVTQARVRAHAA